MKYKSYYEDTGHVVLVSSITCPLKPSEVSEEQLYNDVVMCETSGLLEEDFMCPFFDGYKDKKVICKYERKNS